MAEHPYIPDERYPHSAPLIMGEDDGSAPRAVKAQAYGLGWRKGEAGWVVGDGVDDAIDLHVLAPIATGDTGTAPLTHPGSLRPGFTEPALGFQDRIGTDARDDALTADVSHVTTYTPPAPAGEVTYDLDADPAPVKRGPGRPRKPSA